MDSVRHVTPGRLRRSAEELEEEGLGVVERSSVPDALVDEIDCALRPPRHERRVPSYGSFVLPTEPVDEWGTQTGLEVVSNRTGGAVDDEVRRYADGSGVATSWAAPPTPTGARCRDTSFLSATSERRPRRWLTERWSGGW